MVGYFRWCEHMMKCGEQREDVNGSKFDSQTKVMKRKTQKTAESPRN